MADDARPDRCATCKFWDKPDEPGGTRGGCHRYPPVANQGYGIIVALETMRERGFDAPGETIIRSGVTIRIETDADDWCGEWQAASPAAG